MTSALKIPENIEKEYFLLHEELRVASPIISLEAFNEETFDTECKHSKRAKRSFYCFFGLTLGLALSSLYFAYFSYEYMKLLNQLNLAGEDKTSSIDKTMRFAAFIAFVFFLSFIYSGHKAFRAFTDFIGDEKTRLLKNANHPGIAELIYDVVEIIVNERIPVYTYFKRRRRKLPIHSLFKLRIWGAMLILLGNEGHREALWKDKSMPKGAIILHKKDGDRILSKLKDTFRAYEKAGVDNRDPRFLVTALLSKHHMQICYKVMCSEYYWREKRKSQKSKIINEIVRILLKDWNIWEVFRKNITGNFTAAMYKDNQFHGFAEKLLTVNGRNITELIDILTANDRTARKYFRSLYAISGQDLVPRNTPVK